MEAAGVAQASPTEPEMVSLAIELPKQELEMLQKLAEDRGMTVPQALRQAIRDEKWFRDRIAEGKTILIRESDGELRTVSLP